MSIYQLAQLLPLPDEELQQVLDYASTLSKPEAVTHFSNLLGDSPAVIDFISTFNGRRKDPAAPAAAPAPPAASTSKASGPKKKKAPIHTPEARKVEDYAGPAGKAYNKKDSDLEYISQRSSAPNSNRPSRTASPARPLIKEPTVKKAAQPTKVEAPAPKQSNSTAAGYLISDDPKKSKPKSTPVSRGVPMAGQSTALADLDAAIRSLEITTNPTLEKDAKSRKCNCVAARHPLQAAAPNCLSCGKVICLKEGLGPCTFCGTPLLSSDEIQAMVRELKDERGREKMAANAAAHRRADVAKTPAPFTPPRGLDSDAPSLSEAAAKARDHRDKLLNFQAQNAKRTTVRDEAADFDVSGAMGGMGSMWATPEERAKELKRQQKIMREMEWNARPEYEKRQQVISIDLAGRRVIKTVAPVERPVTPEEDEAQYVDSGILQETSGNRNAGGAFSTNPLLGAVMRPIYDAKGKGAEAEGRSSRSKGWRRVQDDLDNNEGVILDGGAYGLQAVGGDEPERG
ncbi:putative zinc finger motif, c2HC5-type domain-containing protein [Trichoderma breve]|uniref:Zinc finger motif, c2HC5-type domain-containing protein n=1 Tax=Trichoderma breve TaxID=2034170 RepID=A0A9W9E2V3_9HYPO|nr:putative zinc finger motif, c2HC5-type domain-containing protein [Trichoderma breve]KAJ4855904.1 putative zinc finger motif, c2HC5-type domain-containing protein [Trichoderma breve]